MSGLMHRPLVLLLALSGAASAQSLFWDPRFPGEGWAFENQDDVIAVTRYTYDNAARPIYQIAALNQTWRTGGGYLLSDASGSLLQVTGVNQTSTLGALSLSTSVINGIEIINVTGPGFTRRLEPFVYNFSEPIDRFNGVWLVTLFAVDGSDSEISIIQFENRFDTLDLGNGTSTRVKFFRSLTNGTEGLAGFDPNTGFHFTVDDAGFGEFFITAVALLNGTAFGEGAYFNAAGTQISPAYAVIGSSPAPTTRSGNLLVQSLDARKRLRRGTEGEVKAVDAETSPMKLPVGAMVESLVAEAGQGRQHHMNVNE